MLPADGHVHSQFSWDAPQGDMQATCARAVAIGLPALAFTEHVDLTAWSLHDRSAPSRYRGSLDEHGRFLGSPLEVDAYLEEIDRCRHLFPDLRIWAGIELSEGHWHRAAVTDLMSAARPQRVVGSVHALADQHPEAALGDHVEVSDGYHPAPAGRRRSGLPGRGARDEPQRRALRGARAHRLPAADLARVGW